MDRGVFRKVVITEHKDFQCSEIDNQWTGSQRSFCELHPEKLILQIEGSFYLLVYHSCLYIDKYDFLKNLIESVIQENVKDANVIVQKSVTDRDLKDLRLRGIELDKWAYQVHFSCSNGSGKVFSIASKKSMSEILSGEWNEDIKKAYHSGLEYLEENDLNYLKTQLDELYSKNQISYISDFEVHKTTEHLIKSFQSKLNAK